MNLHLWLLASIILGANIITPVAAETPTTAASETSQPRQDEALPAQGNPETEEKPSDTDLIESSEITAPEEDGEPDSGLDLQQVWMFDMNVSMGRRWYKTSGLRGDLAQLTAEWSHYQLPVRFGPNIAVVKLFPSDSLFTRGSSTELSFRATTFYEGFEFLLPYLSIDYKLFAQGSIHAHASSTDQETTGTLDFSSKGYDIVLGITYVWEQLALIIEASAYSSQTLIQKGQLGTINSGGATSVTNKDSEDSDSYRSLLLGLSFEL